MAVAHVAHHNEVLRLGTARARGLEEKLAALLVPILDRAADTAAENFERYATAHVVASAAVRAYGLGLTASAPDANSTMICVKPTPEQAAALADPDGEDPDTLHVTLAYLGGTDGDLATIADALRPVAANHAALTGVVGGYGQFGTPGGGAVGILLPDVPGLVELRVAVTEALLAADIGYARDHGFAAHVTVDGSPEPGEATDLLSRYGMPLTFSEILVVRGDTEIVPVPLVGVPPVTASLTAAGRGRAEFCLPSQLRTKTDPVRLALIQSVAKSTVEGAGVGWDVSNPFVQKVVGQVGKQITHISRTTQLDAMKAIKASYDQGLSIPDTAEAIRSVMRGTSLTRATLIARTELAGAVNGASLAGMQAVDAALPDGAYEKEWMTAPGAMYPRHELYADLDGQTAALDEAFDVGGEALLYPGDPDGDPSEVCNCRCAMSYMDTSGQEVGDAVESLDASASAFAFALPCEAHGLERENVEELVAALYASMTAAGAAGWTAPAPAEVLNIDCGASTVVPHERRPVLDIPAATHAPEHGAVGSNYRLELLPQWARTPVDRLTPGEAQAEAKKLQWSRNRLNHTMRNIAPDDPRVARLREKVDAANARLAELKTRSVGRPVEPPPVTRPVTPTIPEPTTAVTSGDRPFAHYADATLTTQIGRSRAVMKKLFADGRDELDWTPAERVDYEKHSQRLKRLLDERDFRRENKPALPVTTMTQGNALQLVRGTIPRGTGGDAAARGMKMLGHVFDGTFDDTKTFEIYVHRTSKWNRGRWYPDTHRISLNSNAKAWPKGQSRESTFWHEFGHYTDYLQTDPKLVELRTGSQSIAASDWGQDPLMRDVIATIRETAAYKRLKSTREPGHPGIYVSRSHADYLASPRELYARAFAQFTRTRLQKLEREGTITLTAREKTALEGAALDDALRSADVYGTQWGEGDFEVVYDAVAKMAKAKGWIR